MRPRRSSGSAFRRPSGTRGPRTARGRARRFPPPRAVRSGAAGVLRSRTSDRILRKQVLVVVHAQPAPLDAAPDARVADALLGALRVRGGEEVANDRDIAVDVNRRV